MNNNQKNNSNSNASSNLTKIKDNTQFTEVYNLLQRAAEAFSRLSPNIPKQLLEVVQHIYGRLDEISYNIFLASNTMDIGEKKMRLTFTRDGILFMFSSIELLVKTRGLTVGGANTVLTLLKQSFDQSSKWLNVVNRTQR